MNFVVRTADKLLDTDFYKLVVLIYIQVNIHFIESPHFGNF